MSKLKFPHPGEILRTEFWIGLQKDYDMREARAELESKIEKKVVPLSLVS